MGRRGVACIKVAQLDSGQKNGHNGQRVGHMDGQMQTTRKYCLGTFPGAVGRYLTKIWGGVTPWLMTTSEVPPLSSDHDHLTGGGTR